jgi:hypothetical protein
MTMKDLEISIDNNGTIETATIQCNRRKLELTFIMKNGLTKTYSDYDMYACFGLLRADHPEIKFLCKGAKLNVHPSRMSSQMSTGLVAYELKLGIPSEEEDLVRIFDYEDENLTNNIEEQRTFYKRWLESLGISLTIRGQESKGNSETP